MRIFNSIGRQFTREDSGQNLALGHDLAEKWLKLRVLENLRFDKSNGNPRRYWGWRVFGQGLIKHLCY